MTYRYHNPPGTCGRSLCSKRGLRVGRNGSRNIRHLNALRQLVNQRGVIEMATIEELNALVLKGEGEIKTVTSKRVRVQCGECGENAIYKFTYLLPNARRNEASNAYRRDDCTWCSDHAEFRCAECGGGERGWHPKVDGYEACSKFTIGDQYARFFLQWEEISKVSA